MPDADGHREINTTPDASSGADWLVSTLLLAAIYYLSGKLGFLAAIPPGNVTLVWPPSGIAFAAVIILGPRAIPGILIGAAIVNGEAFLDLSSTNAMAATGLGALAIGIGSFLQPLAGVALLKRFSLLINPAQTIAAAAKAFGSIAAACLISCSIGVATLMTLGFATADTAPGTWGIWWLGDLLGILVFTPVTLAIRNKKVLTSALLVLVIVIGLGGTYAASTTIRGEAQAVWEDHVHADTARLSDTFMQWVETSLAPVHAVASVFASSQNVTEDEFWDAISLLEDNAQDFFPPSLAIAVPIDQPGRTPIWKVIYGTDDSGLLAPGETVSNDLALNNAVQAALNTPTTTLIGSVHRDGRASWMTAAIAPPLTSNQYIVLAQINLSELVEGLFKTQAAKGLHMKVVVSAEGRPEQVSAVPRGHNHRAQLERSTLTRTIRAVAGRAHFDFEWGATEDYLGGSGSTLADGLLAGGVGFTGFFTLFISFLVGQNERIRRLVRIRTEELAEKEGELRLALDNLPGGMILTDKNLNIRLMNTQFPSFFGIPDDLLKPGVSHETLLRHLATHGYYGDDVDTDAMIEERMESLRNPSEKAFYDQTPNGRIMEIRRRIAPDGDVVTTATDVTERVTKERELDLALGNMPGGIMMIDDDMTIQLFNKEYVRLYELPEGVIEFGGSLKDMIRYRAERGDYGPGDVDELVRTRVDGYDSSEAGSALNVMPSGRILETVRNPTNEGFLVAIVTDVTEREENERIVRANEARFRSIFDSGAAGMALLDMSGAYIQVNERFCEIVGYTSAELKAMTWRDLTHPDDIAMVEELDRSIEAGERQDFIMERRMVRKDGAEIWTSLSSSQLHDAVGVPQNIFSFVQDITEMKEAEQSIRENEANLRALLDSGPVAIGVVAMESNKRLFVNQHMVELAKARSSEDLVGADLSDSYVDPGQIAEFHRRFEEQGYVRNFEAQRRALDGSTFWCLQSSQPIGQFLGEEARVVWMVDITGMKEAQADLQAQKAIVDTAMSNMAQGITMFDENLNLVASNDQFTKLLKFPAEFGNPGTSMEDLFRYNAERGEYGDGDVEEQVRERIKITKKFEPHEFERTLPDGTILQIKGQPVPQGGFVTTYTDITERVNNERTARVLREAMEVFSDSIILYDAEERVVFSNDKYHEFYPDSPKKNKITGYTQEELLQRSLDKGLIEDPVAKQSPKKWLAARLEERRTGGDNVTETAHKSGKTFLVRHKSTTDGGLIVAHTDITERKQAEAEIAAKEAQLRMTMENMPGAMWLVDADLKVVLVNDQYAEYYSDPDNLMRPGASMRDILKSEIDRGLITASNKRKALKERIDSYKTDAPLIFEDALPDGRIVQLTRTPAPDGHTISVAVDITTRKNAEREIAEKEAEMRLALDNMPGGLCLLDEQLRIVVVNDTYCELYGHPRDVYAVGRPIEDVIRENVEAGMHSKGKYIAKDVEKTVQQRIAMFRSGRPGDSEREMPGGRVLHVRHNPVIGGGVVLIASDITARRRAEEEIETQREQLFDILDNVQQGMVLFDENKKPIAWNARYPDALNIDPDIFTPGFSMEDLALLLAERGQYGDGDPKELARRRVELLWSGNSRTEVSFDGVRTFDAQSNLTPDGRLVVSYSDITEQKKVLAAVQEQQAQITAIMESVPDALITIDIEGRINSVNKSVTNVFGYVPDELIGRNVKLLMPSEIAEFHDAAVEKYVETGKGQFLGQGPRELSGIHKDGHRFPIDLSISEAVMDGDNRLFVGVARDITERKQAAEALETERERLADILNNISQGVLLWDSDQTIISWNERFLEATGFDPAHFNANFTLTDMARIFANLGYYGEGDVEKLTKDRVDALWSGTRSESTYASGRMFYVHSTRTPSGRLIMSYSDIEDLKEAQKEIEAHRAQLDDILTNISQGVVMFDEDRRLMAWNAQYPDALNIDPGLLQEGKLLEEITLFQAERGDYGDGEPDVLAEERAASLYAGAGRSDMQYGEGLIFDVQNLVTSEGKLLVTYTDITERKKSEQIIANAMKLINESIAYASRIQRSVLPTRGQMEQALADHFAVWEPRDVVGGDVYLLRECEDGMLLVVADCTGHGVPGAFMAMIATGSFDQALIENPSGDPATLLTRVNQLVKTTLGQDGAEGESDDGFECGICRIDPSGETMTYAGARFELWEINNAELHVTKGDKPGIGYRRTAMDQTYTNHEIKVAKSAMYYMFTDGITDQVGGAKRRAFGKKRLMSNLLDYYPMDLTKQAAHLMREFKDYQHNEERRDDVTFVGFVPKFDE